MIVAKIEAEKNEHPHLTGDAYPYILFYSAGAQQPIKYSGDPNMRASLLSCTINAGFKQIVVLIRTSGISSPFNHYLGV